MSARLETVGVIDRSVGARLRARRELMGLSPESLAVRLGCEADLILQYEGGAVRINAITLMWLTRICRVTVGYFLAEIRDGPARPPRSPD